ncbi:MAG: hypothetical protein GY869_08805 [Planctomycetes bacterium]|nr:hypothetical protein [Planctomycetota bacterium]
MILRKWLQFVVGSFMSIITLGKKRPDTQQTRQMEYSTSTRRMGLTFTEKIRDNWRRRWLKMRR